MISLINANTLHIPLADQSVHMIATSPPYWGLRNYGEDDQLGLESLHDCLAWARSESPCGQCYVCQMRTIAAELWRVLREDGTLWLNLGDSYAGSWGSMSYPGGSIAGRRFGANGEGNIARPVKSRVKGHLKPKDLVGIPWRVALALQADGWTLRSDIVWGKKNPMPESVTDRPTKAHEYIFLLTKSKRYFYDVDAVREELNGKTGYNPTGRNKRTVWTIATTPYPGAHFATWPPNLVETMIKAGSSEHGVCPHCGAPWRRVINKIGHSMPVEERHGRIGHNGQPPQISGNYWDGPVTQATDIWIQSCTCPVHDPTPAIVLDPFVGSGTTLMVARQLGRSAIGLDISFPYLRYQARARLDLDKLNAWEHGPESIQPSDLPPLPLFAL